MKNEIHIMSTYVGFLMMSRPTYSNTDMLKSINSESERLKEMLSFSFSQGADRFQVAETLRSYHAHFIELADILWERARQHNPIARSALLVMISLVHYIEQQYGGFLDKNQALAAFESFKLNNHLSAELLSIKLLLVSKKVSEPLVHQVSKAFEGLFKESKHGVFSIADRDYVRAFLPKLSLLANDKGDKNWNMKFRQLLIKNNFNDMGVYNFFVEESNKQVSDAGNFERQHQLLYEKASWLEQLQLVPGIGFNKEIAGLKRLLSDHIARLQTHIRERKELIVDRPKIHKTVTVNEIALELHYEHAIGVYNSSSKREAAIAIQEHIRSKGTDIISLHSLIKFDKIGQLPAAALLIKRWESMLSMIKEDFDL